MKKSTIASARTLHQANHAHGGRRHGDATAPARTWAPRVRSHRGQPLHALVARRLPLLALVIALGAGACVVDEGGARFEAGPARGEIGGVPRTFAFGMATAEGASDLSFYLLTGAAMPTCDAGLEGDSVSFSLPNQVGTYELFSNDEFFGGLLVNLFEQATFSNNLTDDGAIEIVTITATEVAGRIVANFDDETYVNGNFTAVICP